MHNFEQIRFETWGVGKRHFVCQEDERQYRSCRYYVRKRKQGVLFGALLVIFAFFWAVCLSGMTLAAGSSSTSGKIKLSRNEVTVAVGEKYTVRLLNAEGKVKWSSSDKTVAAVRAGVIRGRSCGTCVITALYNNKKYKCRLAVEEIALSEDSLTMVKHRKTTLRVNGTNQIPVWSTTNPYIANVDQNGVVTSGAAGKAVITATCGDVQLFCNVRVVAPSVKTFHSFYPVETSNRDSILICGSSSIDLWITADEAFAPYKVINVAMCGTVVYSWKRLFKQLVEPYHPKAVVVYAGSNDLNAGRSGKKNAKKTIDLLKTMHDSLKDTSIFYVSIVPVVSRPDDWKKIQISNKLVKKYCASVKNLYYIDLASSFLLEDGTPDPSLSKRDDLHPNAQGYEIWDKIVAGTVKRTLLR